MAVDINQGSLAWHSAAGQAPRHCSVSYCCKKIARAFVIAQFRAARCAVRSCARARVRACARGGVGACVPASLAAMFAFVSNVVLRAASLLIFEGPRGATPQPIDQLRCLLLLLGEEVYMSTCLHGWKC